ncbi:MAG: DUF2384 domain-containing protein [Solirubrobacterales bacterium]|nr:DUF2384 domain-containing protein [Solirubrobacterales bacterium]
MKKASNEVSTSVQAKLRALLAVMTEPDMAELLDLDLQSLPQVLADPGRSQEVAARIIDAEYVVSRAAQVFVGSAVRGWLFGHSPIFAGARPIDVIKADGPSLVVTELERIAAGGYA